MKIMLIQPMNGKSDNDILKERDKIKNQVEKLGHEIINTWLEYEDDSLRALGVKNFGAYYLGESIRRMSQCDAVVLLKGWEKAKGCKIEHDVAVNYGITIFTEKEIIEKGEIAYEK